MSTIRSNSPMKLSILTTGILVAAAMSGCQTEEEGRVETSDGVQTSIARSSDMQRTASSETSDRPPQSPAVEEAPPSFDGIVKPPSMSMQALEKSTFQVPQGEPPQVLEFLKEMYLRQESASTDQERKMSIQARIDGADELIRLKPDEPTRVIAVRTKLDALQTLFVIDDQAEAKQKLVSFCEEATHDSNPVISTHGEFLMFAIDARALLDGNQGGFNEIMQRLETLIQRNVDNQEVFAGSQEFARGMFDKSRIEEGKAVVQTIVRGFSNSNDPSILAGVESLKDQMLLQESGLNAAQRDLLLDQEGAEVRLLDNIRQLLDSGDLSLNLYTELALAAHSLESTHHYVQAMGAYLQLSEVIDSLEPQPGMTAPQLEELGLRVSQGMNRLRLVGARPQFSGTSLSGKKIDWTTYKDRVVLVCFWSTETEIITVERLQSIKGVYDVFKAQGFEIIGVNVDESTDTARAFAMSHPMPFESLTSSSLISGNMPAIDLAREGGFDTTPFSILIDRDGTVVDINIFSRTLTTKVSDLLMKRFQQ